LAVGDRLVKCFGYGWNKITLLSDPHRFSASWLHWGHRSPDTLKIPFCLCCWTHWSLHGVPWVIVTLMWGFTAAKRLKNVAVGVFALLPRRWAERLIADLIPVGRHVSSVRARSDISTSISTCTPETDWDDGEDVLWVAAADLRHRIRTEPCSKTASGGWQTETYCCSGQMLYCCMVVFVKLIVWVFKWVFKCRLVQIRGKRSYFYLIRTVRNDIQLRSSTDSVSV